MKRLLNQDVYGMARVGFIDEYEIYVNTDDGGAIPHFHYRLENEWDKFHTCICIETSEYFHHNNKQNILNSKQKKSLDQFMKSAVQISKYADKFSNNWQLVCFLWDLNNSNVEISKKAKQPDYTKLI
jgi:hypothetical protein